MRTSIRSSQLAAAILLLIAWPALAQESNDTPERAIALTGPVSGNVPAAPPILRAGRFVFYRFDHPGDGSPVTVEAEITPGDIISADRAGFHVYGPRGGRLYAESAGTGGHPSHRSIFAPTEAGTYLVQIFNYNVTPIHYQLSVLGVATVAAPTPAPPGPTPLPPTPTPTPAAVSGNDAPERALDLDTPVAASLPGDPSGRFHYYRLAHPGGGAGVRIDLDVAPSDTVTVRSSGFVVYGAAGREVTRGGYTGGRPTHTTTVYADAPTVYLIQVNNYGRGPIDYRLQQTRER
ncbi:MAG TPA: hypothetical protein VGM69_02185 [Chloroflexota bacterium]|jgi:hypothetical protein